MSPDLFTGADETGRDETGRDAGAGGGEGARGGGGMEFLPNPKSRSIATDSRAGSGVYTFSSGALYDILARAPPPKSRLISSAGAL